MCSSATFQGLATKGKFELNRVEKALSILKGVINYSDFKDVDMVIEVRHYILSFAISICISV